MNKFALYLKTTGPIATLKRAVRVASKRSGLIASTTLLMKTEPVQKTPIEKKFDVQLLDKNRAAEFDQMKFFTHISAEQLLTDQHCRVYLAIIDGNIAGYTMSEFDKQKEIHNLGTFLLKKGEGWIGPSFVDAAFRSRGIHTYLIRYAMNDPDLPVTQFYTAINKENIPSVRSFLKAGFSEYASVTIRKCFGKNVSVKKQGDCSKLTLEREKY